MKARECRTMIVRWQQEDSFDRLLPEVALLRGVPQPERYHAEGDAYVHTMLALDAVDPEADGRIFWGVLLHDIGKAGTTHFIDGRWRAYGHAEAGAILVPAVMERIGQGALATEVAWLVRHHLFHFSWNLRDGDRLTKNQRRLMEHPLFPLLLEVCMADAAGSLGVSDKAAKITRIAERYAEEVAGEK